MKTSLLSVFVAITTLASTTAFACGEKEYGIVIIPEAKVTKEAAELNQKAANFLSGLENPENNYHITLYHGVFPDGKLEEIYKKIESSNFKPLDLKFTTIYSTSNRWVDRGVEKSREIENLHRKIVEIANSYHIRPLKRVSDIYDKLDKEQQKQADLYGVTGVLDSYKPHMTVFYAYPENKNLVDAAAQLSPIAKEHESFKADTIAIGELGYNGNLTKILYTVKL